MHLLAMALLTAAFGVFTNRAGPEEAKAMLRQFAEHYRAVGRAQALMHFNSGMPPYLDADRGIFVMCMTATRRIVAYPADPKLVGSSVDALKDADGKPIGAAILKAGSAKAGGSVRFKARNALTGKVEARVALARKFDNDVCGVVVDSGK